MRAESPPFTSGRIIRLSTSGHCSSGHEAIAGELGHETAATRARRWSSPRPPSARGRPCVSPPNSLRDRRGSGGAARLDAALRNTVDLRRASLNSLMSSDAELEERGPLHNALARAGSFSPASSTIRRGTGPGSATTGPSCELVDARGHARWRAGWRRRNPARGPWTDRFERQVNAPLEVGPR